MNSQCLKQPHSEVPHHLSYLSPPMRSPGLGMTQKLKGQCWPSRDHGYPLQWVSTCAIPVAKCFEYPPLLLLR